MTREHAGAAWRVAGVFLLVALGGCNAVPVHEVSQTFAIEVSEVTDGQGPIEIDFLWVIDSSTSMGHEQAALARGFSDFVEVLNLFLGNIDIRVAVISMNDPKFNRSPAAEYAPGTVESRVTPCLGNQDCQVKHGSEWACKPPKDATELYAYNLAVNSSCYYSCGGAAECCSSFCAPDLCGGDSDCEKDSCVDVPNDVCLYECDTFDGASGCQMVPDTADCPSSVPEILTASTLQHFKCNATLKAAAGLHGGLEQGLRIAWEALDPEGDYADQAQSLLRPDAYLVVIFVTDEDDCSIDPRFGAPSKECDGDDDCRSGSKCRTDIYFSQLKGQQIKLCEGEIKADYYNRCAGLGEFKGDAHHTCAYDLSCQDCARDEDCEAGFYCKQGKKCRPIFAEGWGAMASYQQPPGTPLFALEPVSDVYSKLRSLKSDPGKVLLAVVAGDGVVFPPDKSDSEPDRASLISQACLADERLTSCQAYGQSSDRKGCYDDPLKAGCEAYAALKLDCVRECFQAARGSSGNAYVCGSDNGIASYGSRYHRLAAMFGPNGISTNICGEAGIGAALQQVAELVVKRVTKICLPQAPKRDEAVKVMMTIVDTEGAVEERRVLVEGPTETGGDYLIEFPTQECCFPDDAGDCTGTLKAITFNDVLDPRARIEVRYEAQTE